ncbi:MAG: hypothetical protein KF832_19035 [Caldilineaceae bacterium]|nr:hypothetical protein [Caldilineaceae bacterium]
MQPTTILDQATFDELINTLEPFLIDPNQRQALLWSAFHNSPLYRQINFAGSSHIFTINLVNTLLQYGADEQGRHPMMPLFAVIRAQVGSNKQQKIDQLQQQLQLHLSQKGWIACARCRTTNRTTAQFCRSCGHTLKPPIFGGRQVQRLVAARPRLPPRALLAMTGLVLLSVLGWAVGQFAREGTLAPAGTPVQAAATVTTSPGVAVGATPFATLAVPPTPGAAAPFVLFSGDPRSSSSLCRGFQSQCAFADCDFLVKLIEGPGCVEGDDDRIVPGLYRVTLTGRGSILAGRMTSTDPLFPVPADGYAVTLSGAYTFCWPGWRAATEPFGILAVVQEALPNRIDQVEIRYLGAACP